MNEPGHFTLNAGIFSTASPQAKSAHPAAAVVPSPVHVSCFITAANRATPVFEVVPERHCVRVVNKPLGDPSTATTASSSSSGLGTSTAGNASNSSSANPVPTAEWDFHTLFASSSSSHASDFYREITQPAFRHACDGWNTNIVAWGVHPTQKFRLLFGKSAGNIPSQLSSVMVANGMQPCNEKDVLELFGQLGGLLYEFFVPHMSLSAAIRSRQTSLSSSGWRLGISSWIIVNNHVVDLLKPAVSPSSSRKAGAESSSSSGASAPLSFVSLEAKTFSSACKIIQIAKTNRIVMKHNAEHAHFFLRLAFFYDGQVSTMHFVDLIDLKDFKDQSSMQEKQELLEILHEIRQPPSSPRSSTASPTQTRRGSGASTPCYKSRTMVLSNFMLPLLSANAKTFLYANVIDSRTSLRESVQLLNAVANVKGFTCACKRLCGVDFVQLGFQSPPDELLQQAKHDQESKQNEATRDAAKKALAAVAVGESLLSRLASSTSTSLRSLTSFSSSFSSTSPFEAAPNLSAILSSSSLSSPLASSSSSSLLGDMSKDTTKYPSDPQSNGRKVSFSDVPMESETLHWLESFSQRKRDILGGKIDTIVPLQPDAGVVSPSSPLPLFQQNERVDEDPTTSVCTNGIITGDAFSPSTLVGAAVVELHAGVKRIESTSTTTATFAQTSVDLLERLRGSVTSDEQATTLRPGSAEPLPLSDEGMHATSSSSGELLHSPHIAAALTTRCDATSEEHRPPAASTAYSSPSPGQPTAAPPSTASKPESSVQPLASPPTTTSRRAASSPMPPHSQLYYDTLEKANVPPRVTAPPNVEGLDAVTARKIQATDASLLRKNYDTLLTIVQEQQQLREVADAKAAEAVHDLEEMRAVFEVQIENMKLANVALRSKVRSLEKQSALPKVFDQYEQELQSLLKEVQQLRDRNVVLELKMTENGRCSGPGSVHDLKKRYQTVVDEKQHLEKQVLEYRKKERQFLVHSKLVGDSTRRVDQLSRELTNKEEALVATKLGKLRLNAEMNQAQEEADLLHQENEKLLVEKAAATEELLATKMYLASLANEQRKADILDQFVKKHGDRMSRLKNNPVPPSSGAGGTRAANGYESWRRDAAAKECEDKVFATVKRSLPQLVPLVNKLLRRLEMQELSLREYSERETDFINLLVELVSDQPAVSLKNMIQQEMQKLSA